MGGKKSAFSDAEVQGITLEQSTPWGSAFSLPCRRPWSCSGWQRGTRSARATLELAVRGATGGWREQSLFLSPSHVAQMETKSGWRRSQTRGVGRRERDEDKVPAEPTDIWAKQSSWMGSWDSEPEAKARRREERGELLAEGRRCRTQSQ